MDSKEIDPPDIENDPILAVLGGASTVVVAPFTLMDQVRGAAPLVRDDDFLPPDSPVRNYVRAHNVLFTGEWVVGTVADIADYFRRQLERLFHTLTVGGGHVIPSTGEASLRKQTETFRRMGILPEKGEVRVLPKGDLPDNAGDQWDQQQFRARVHTQAVLDAYHSSIAPNDRRPLVLRLRQYDFNYRYAHLFAGGITAAALQEAVKLADKATRIQVTDEQLVEMSRILYPDGEPLAYGDKLLGLVLVEGDFGPYPE